MEIIDMRSATITEKGQIVIPREIRDLKGFEEGSKVVLLSFQDRIEIRPMKQLERLYPALMSEKSLAKHWNTKEEDKAWKKL